MSTKPDGDKPRILVVDDDSDVRFMLRRYLGRHGFDVEVAEDGARLRALIADGDFDLVVLDLNMPGEDGISLARYLRDNHDVGIIMLTAAAEVVDRIVGLEVGADDYVTKPFEPRELLARIKSVLRRLEHGAPAAPSGVASGRMPFGNCSLDMDARRLFDENGEEIAITSMEYDLLKAFADHPNKVLSRDQLLNLAHNRDWEPFDRSIDIRITRLRRKIEPDPGKPQIIKTVRGAGYVYVVENR
ncbi:MAG: response regulator [Gammaproteobacteria bacterium]|nr:response regulator [Gammaproteobacteria bacterium]NIM74601.1 response regulator [Gammaproteobacteria bacterium]NIO26434.1 response regulator [Gammaproteobacteria bacterium]NIO66986.1 response regulator [Gammaproteobacteria bacterium]NIP46816.1 response regulator [Gammaproteobacteria bacterium]